MAGAAARTTPEKTPEKKKCNCRKDAATPPTPPPTPGVTGTATVLTVQRGPFLQQETWVGDKSYTGIGLAWPPALGGSLQTCHFQTNPGYTQDDLLTGHAVGMSLVTPGAGLSGSVSGSSAGTMYCAGQDVSISPGFAGTYTYSVANQPGPRAFSEVPAFPDVDPNQGSQNGVPTGYVEAAPGVADVNWRE
jgi:hypothetical protein